MRLGKLLAQNRNIKGFEKDEIEFHNFAIFFEHMANHSKTTEEKTNMQIKATICDTLSKLCKELQTIKI
jgi:hypothetical protein